MPIQLALLDQALCQEPESPSPATKERAAEGAADLSIYLIPLSQKLDIDLLTAAHHKLKLNAGHCPTEKARRNARNTPLSINESNSPRRDILEGLP